MLKQCVTFLVFGFTITEGLKCYTCTVGENDADKRCITDPGDVQSGQAIVSCKKKYCTSVRMEYLDPPGKIASFYRGCEKDLPNKNTVQEDGTYRIWYKACTKDLCNGSDGKDIGGGGEEIDGPGIVIFAPGTGKASSLISNLSLCLMLLIFALNIM